MIFRFSGALLRFVGYRKEIQIEASSVARGIDALLLQCPALRPVLLDGKGAVRATHRLFMNSEMIGRDGLERPATPADCVEILTAIAGG